MTEPDVASSDPRNLQTKLTKIIDNDVGRSVRYVLNGKKWWSTGAMDPRCQVALVVAKMDYRHPSCYSEEKEQKTQSKRDRKQQQTVVLVPMSHPGVKCIRPLTVFGYDDAPHGHGERITLFQFISIFVYLMKCRVVFVAKKHIQLTISDSLPSIFHLFE